MHDSEEHISCPGPGGTPSAPGTGESGDWGPPDWFAACAEPEPEPAPEPGPGPGREPGSAQGLVTDGRGGGGSPELGFELVAASELPSGRRRRRSALEGERESGRPGESGQEPATRQSTPAHGRGAVGAGRRGRAGRGEDVAGGRGRAAGAAPPAESTDPAARARDICLRMLTGTAKTRKQLADALRKREIPDEVAEEVLDRYEEVGLIDDAAFAEAWVESRHAVRGLARRALAQELRTRGVAGELVEQAVSQLGAEDEAEAARALVERKLRATRGLERQARTRRLVGMLARRGYSEGLAFRVVREALGEEDDGFGGPDGP